MIRKYLLFNLVYALLFILVLVSRYKQYSLLNYGLIPCITLVLLVFFCLTTKLSGRFHQRLFTGLVFALTGSTLFLLRGYDPSYFSYGLIAFLICTLRLPTLGCIFIVALLIMMAAFRNQRVNQTSFKLILAGVLFFIGADAILAHAYFINSLKSSDLLICTLYMIAQYLIVMGGIERKLIRPLSAD